MIDLAVANVFDSLSQYQAAALHKLCSTLENTVLALSRRGLIMQVQHDEDEHVWRFALSESGARLEVFRSQLETAEDDWENCTPSMRSLFIPRGSDQKCWTGIPHAQGKRLVTRGLFTRQATLRTVYWWITARGEIMRTLAERYNWKVEGA